MMNSTRSVRVFTLPRERPWRRVDAAPESAALGGANFSGAARPGEFFVFQVGLFPSTSSIQSTPLRVRAADLKSGSGGIIAASSIRALSLGGAGPNGKPFTKDILLRKGVVQILWFGVDIPKSAIGRYSGNLELLAGSEILAKVDIELCVEGETVEDHGDQVAGKLSRLRWLDSTVGSEPTVTKPFTPVRVGGRTISVLGRDLRLGTDGLPKQIESFFNPSNTLIVNKGQPILGKPFVFVVDTGEGTLRWKSRFGGLEKTDVEARWTASLAADAAECAVEGRMDYTGSGSLKITLTAKREIHLKDISLELSWLEAKARYFMGLGQADGKRSPMPVEWKWSAERHQDCFWMGDVNGGLMLRFKDENYRRPLVNIYYKFSPLVSPKSWDNEGRGGVTVGSAVDGAVPVKAYSGERFLEKGASLMFIADFYLTPFRTIDTEAQWATRFAHPFPKRAPEVLRNAIKEMDSLSGPNVLNIHQAHAAAPFINYPYSDLSLPSLRELVAGAHAKGAKARVYYTAREITQNMPELFALHSMNGEIIFPGPGKEVRTVIHKDGPHPWLIENLCEDFIPAWTDHLQMPDAEWDLSVITRPDSRWNNFYLEGLRWMTEALDIDGVYLDDTALDANSLRRARRILDTRPGRLLDFHTWNHFCEWAGYGHNLLIYMELLPYLDRLWIGEGFNCDKVAPDYWLVAMSGLPFGVMSEMLDGANPWRGLVFGETARLGWSGDPRGIWAAWDKFGIHGAEYLPYFIPGCPVRTGLDDVLASVYRSEGKCLVALASWAAELCDVTLEVDWKSLGLNPAKASFYAPTIPGMQRESLWKVSDAIRVEPGRGYFLVIDEECRTLTSSVPDDGESVLFVDFFSAPTLEDGWSVVKKSSDSASVGNIAGALRITSSAGAYAGVERKLRGNVRSVVVALALDSKKVWTHGPGVAFVWPTGVTVAMVCHPSENRVHLHSGSESQKVRIGDPAKIVELRIQIDKEFAVFEARQDVKLEPLGRLSRAGLTGEPIALRIGKMADDGSWSETGAESVNSGECVIKSVKVMGR